MSPSVDAPILGRINPMSDDANSSGVLRASLIAIILVLVGLTLWAIDEKLDVGGPMTRPLIVSQK